METTLGKRIAALRRDKGLKQDELAQQLGVTPQAVSKWENDQTCPDITLLPKLAKILGVSVDELLSGKAEPEVPAVRVLPAEQRKDLKDMVLRIVVDSAEGDKVRVNLPLGLVEAAMDMGMDVTQFTGTDALKGIDLGKILDLVRCGSVGNLVEVESAEGDTVRIFVEGAHAHHRQRQGLSSQHPHSHPAGVQWPDGGAAVLGAGETRDPYDPEAADGVCQRAAPVSPPPPQVDPGGSGGP